MLRQLPLLNVPYRFRRSSLSFVYSVLSMPLIEVPHITRRTRQQRLLPEPLLRLRRQPDIQPADGGVFIFESDG